MASHEYAGTVNTTVTGKACQRWSFDTPHVPNSDFVTDDNFSDGSIAAAENYCRNPQPDWVYGPWCYTTDPDVRWESCNVPMCDVGKFRPGRK